MNECEGAPFFCVAGVGVGKTAPSSGWYWCELPALARFSLLLMCIVLFGNPSCLLTSVAEFPEPVASPPFVNANTAVATPHGGVGVPVTRLIRVSSATQDLILSAEVRSDDAGRLLRSRAFINYKTGDANFDYVFGGEAIAPGTFEEVRNISASFDPRRLQDGCYQVALIITHEFDEKALIPINQDDTAIVVWWMLKGDPAAVRMSQCPSVPPLPDTEMDEQEPDR